MEPLQPVTMLPSQKPLAREHAVVVVLPEVAAPSPILTVPESSLMPMRLPQVSVATSVAVPIRLERPHSIRLT